MTITCKVTKNMLDKIFFESFNKDISAIEAAYFEPGKITFSQPALIQVRQQKHNILLLTKDRRNSNNLIKY